MTKKLIFVFLFGISTGYIYAQSRLSEKITLSVSPGLAFPIGVFAKKDIANAVIYQTDRICPAVSSIEKSKSGLAKIGYSFLAALSYKFSNHFYTFIRSGVTINPVSVSEMDDFY